MTAPSSVVDERRVLGIGVDAVDVARFRTVLERRPGLAQRLFTDAERSYAESGKDPGPRLAARFAAKEAVLKALGVGIGATAFRDVEVVRGDDGAPRLALVGRAAALAADRGVRWWHVSLTHTDLVAVASVLAEGDVVTGGDA
ncbi:MAG TPA: holo-ACP synthase [Acidimicrobiales bacterium]|nr:holo-ACP synthase [Acidimicrobiales bacterium]